MPNAASSFNEIDWIKEFFDSESMLNTEQTESVKNFVFLWNLFERYACERYADINSINSLFNRLSDNNVLSTLSCIDTIFQYFQNRYITDGMPNKLFEKLRFRATTKECEAKSEVILALKVTDSSRENKVKAILFIIWRLRNNLFHGEKNIAKIETQNENFKNANQFLADILSEMKRNNLLTPDSAHSV